MKTSFAKYQRALLFILVLTFAAFLYTGCSKSSNNGYGMSGSTGSPGPGQVWMQNTQYVPSSITIAVNGTVTWINKDGFDHTVAADDNSWFSGNVPSGGSFTHQFTAAGTYGYHCTIHPQMTGTVIVK